MVDHRKRPGRRRRFSDSSVSSVDTLAIEYIDEKYILKRTREPDSNEWPIFVLKNAAVYRRDESGGNLIMARLTHVDTQGPFIIRGDLDLDEDDLEHARTPNIKKAHIELPKCYTYSMSWDPCIVWAAGAAGWFEIEPSPEYRTVYDKMCEGIALYYTIGNFYDESRQSHRQSGSHSKWRQPPLEEVYLHYAGAIGDGSVLPDVLDRCRDHAPFLLAHFPKDAEIMWTKTDFYAEMHKSYPPILKEIEMKESVRPPKPDLANMPSPSPVPSIIQAVITRQSRPQTRQLERVSLTHRAKSGSSVDEAGISTTRTAQRRTRANTESQDESSEEDDDSASEESDAASPMISQSMDFDESLPPNAAPSAPASSRPPPPRSITSTPNLSQIPDNWPPAGRTAADILLDVLEEVRKGSNGKDIKHTRVNSYMHMQHKVKHYASALEICQRFAKHLLANLSPRWHQTSFYAWLLKVQDEAPKGAALQPEGAIIAQLAPRNHSDVFIPRSSSAAVSTPNPRLGNGSGSGKKVPPTSAGKAATLRLASTSKRQASYTDSDDNISTRARKNAKLAHLSPSLDTPNIFSPVSNPSNSDDDDDSNASSSSSLESPASNESGDLVVVRSIKLPSMTPQGPNGTWTCSQVACGYVVRGAEEAEGKEKIAAHFRDHETAAVAVKMELEASSLQKMEIAVAEGTKGRLPIDHLLEKIRSLGEASLERGKKVVDGVVVPAPIKRQMLV